MHQGSAASRIMEILLLIRGGFRYSDSQAIRLCLYRLCYSNIENLSASEFPVEPVKIKSMGQQPLTLRFTSLKSLLMLRRIIRGSPTKRPISCLTAFHDYPIGYLSYWGERDGGWRPTRRDLLRQGSWLVEVRLPIGNQWLAWPVPSTGRWYHHSRRADHHGD